MNRRRQDIMDHFHTTIGWYESDPGWYFWRNVEFVPRPADEIKADHEDLREEIEDDSSEQLLAVIDALIAEDGKCIAFAAMVADNDMYRPFMKWFAAQRGE